MFKLRRVDPFASVAIDRRGIPLHHTAQIEVQRDQFVLVRVFNLEEEFFDRDVEPDLFFGLADCAGLEHFAEFAFASREFPEAAERIIGPPL